MLNTVVVLHRIDSRRMAVEYFADGVRRDTRRMLRLVTYENAEERLTKLQAVDREWSC